MENMENVDRFDKVTYFWKNHYFWIIGTSILLVAMWYFQILNNLSTLFVLGAFMIGLAIGSIFNVGVHFLVADIPRIKEKIKTGKYYYSQCGQDKWVLEDIFDFKEGGFFLELGSLDGINISNTYILEKKFKWKGICIEANDVLFKKLKSNRNCICVNACVDDSIKEIRFKDTGLSGSGGIIDKDTDNRDLKKTAKFIYKKTIPLVDILIEHKAPKVIDYFSLDVEGAEYRILKNFPFNKYKFLAMNIERPNKELIKLLRDNGYIKVGSNPTDKLFIHEKFNDLQKKNIKFKKLKSN